MSVNAETVSSVIKWDVLDTSKNKVSEIELDPAIFGVKVKLHLIHEVVVMQEANKRRGTAETKTRAYRSGGGIKPWRQKGTGRARSGSTRSPIWVGGGVAFGPHPRDYSYRPPRKVRRAALKSALSLRVAEKKLVVLDGFNLEAIKTKVMDQMLDNLELFSVLIVISEQDDKVEMSARNIPNVKVLRADGINVRDIMKYENLMLTKASVEKIQGALK